MVEFSPVHISDLRELSHSPSVATAAQIKYMALECIASRLAVASAIKLIDEDCPGSARDVLWALP